MNSSGNIVNNMIISRKKTKTVFFVCFFITTFNSLQFSLSVVSNSLQTHGLQHTSLPVHHQLPELTQTHVHRVGDAIHQAGDDDVTWCTVLYNTVSRNGRNSNKYTQGFLSHSLKALSTHENYFSKYDL